MRRVLVAIAAALLVLTGCDLGSDVVVRPDGSGSYSVVLSAPKGDGKAGEAIYAALRKASAASAVPFEVTRHASGTESGARGTFAFRSLADLDRMRKAMAATGGGLGGARVSRGSKGWAFVASSDEGLARPPGDAALGAPGGRIDAAALARTMRITVRVELPGAPAAHNATTVTRTPTSSTFTWRLPVGRVAADLTAATTFVGDQATVALAQGETPLRVKVVGADAQGSGGIGSGGSTSKDERSPALLLWLGAGLVVLTGVGAAVIARRSREADEPPLPGDDPVPAT